VQIAVEHGAGIVDQDIEAAVTAAEGLPDRLPPLRRRDVGFDAMGDGARPQAAAGLLQLRQPPPGEIELEAAPGRLDGRCRSPRR
jgi:hypothetical protein